MDKIADNVIFRIQAPPGRRIKIEFTDWSVPKSGGGCEVLFLGISDGVSALELGKETKKKAVTVCGQNPGMTSTFLVPFNYNVASAPLLLKIRNQSRAALFAANYSGIC